MENQYFDRCFRDKSNTYFKNMIKLIEKSYHYTSDVKYTEKHHIVPKSWFHQYNIPLDNSENNIIRLSCADHLKMHVILFYYFASINNIHLCKRMHASIYNMYKHDMSYFKKYGDFSKEEYEVYEKERNDYYENGDSQKRFYSDIRVKQMWDEYKDIKDPQLAFEYINQKYGLGYNSVVSLRTLFKRYIDSKDMEKVMRAHENYGRAKAKGVKRKKGMHRKVKKLAKKRSNIEYSALFNLCFAKRDSQYFKNIISLIDNNFKNKYSEETPEKYSIIPRQWMNYNLYDYDIIKGKNEIYVTSRDYLELMINTILYFKDCGEKKLYLIMMNYLWNFDRNTYYKIKTGSEITEDIYKDFERNRGLKRSYNKTKRKVIDYNILAKMWEIYKIADDSEDFQKRIDEAGLSLDGLSAYRINLLFRDNYPEYAEISTEKKRKRMAHCREVREANRAQKSNIS